MSATQPLSALRSCRSLARTLRKSAIAGWTALGMAVLFSTPAQAQNRSIAIATDQSSLNVSNQFGVPVNRAEDAAGDYAFIGDGNTAVFYRKAGGSTVRLLQAGDPMPVPGFTGSQVGSFATGILMNSSGRILLNVGFTLADGLRHSAVMTYDGPSATFNIVASSDATAAGEPAGTIYGQFGLLGINDNGDVAFSSPLLPLGPLGQQVPALTYFVASGGGAPVRVAGVGDPVTGISGGVIGSISVGFSFNSSGQLLFGATVAAPGAGTKTALLVALAPGLIQKVVSTGDTSPTGGTFGAVLASSTTASMNDSGQVVFWSTTSTGGGGIWLWTATAGIATLTALQNGAPAPAPLTGNLSFSGLPGALSVNNAGSVLVVPSIATEVLRYHLSGGAIDVVAYPTEPAPNLSGKTFSSFIASMANDDTVGFNVAFLEGGNGIYSQIGTATPALVAAQGATAPVNGGGTFLLGTSSPKSLGAGLVFFNAGIAGGTAYYGEFLATASGIQSSLMSTADPLPAGARVVLPAFSAGTTGAQIAFLAQQAGGLLSLYENNLGGAGGNSTEFSTTSTLLATEGEAAPGGLGPITFSFVLNPNGTPIFANQVGQVLVPASVPQGSALFLASATGLTKVAAVGDLSPISGAIYAVLGSNTAGPSPLNDSGQVAFAAGLGNGEQGVFEYSPGGTVKIAATGDTVPGVTGTFSSLIGGIGNPNLAINSSGQVALPAILLGTGAPRGFFVGSGGPLTKIAASGDVAGGSTLTTVIGPLAAFSSQEKIAFQGRTAAGSDGIFVGTVSGPPVAIALDGATAPATGGGTFNTAFTSVLGGTTFITTYANVALNDEGDIAFRSGVTGGTTNSGFFRILASGPNAGIVQAVALQGKNAPGGLGTFGAMGGSTTPGFTFALGSHGELAFAGTVITTLGPPIGGDFEVATDDSLSKIALSGDAAPWSGGGTVTLQALSISAYGDSFIYQLGASGGTARQAVLINLPPSGGDPSVTSLVSSLNPSIQGQNVLFTATVTGTLGYTPTNVVTLADNGALIAVGELGASGQVSFNLSTLAAGSHSLVAWYIGDNVFAASMSAPVTQVVTSAVSLSPSSTSLGSSTNPSNLGQAVVFTATVTSTAGGTPTGNVGFLDSGVLIGTGTLNGSGQATFSTSTLAFGPHSISAEYFGDPNYASSITASTLNQTVEPPTTSNTIFTVAGGGPGGPGICSTNRILGIFANDYYVFSCFQIFRVTPDGNATLIAGNGMIGYAGDNGPATNAEFGNGFGGGVLDASGNLYLADTGNNRIRVVNTQTTPITVQGVTIQPGNIATLAGNGTAGFLDNMSATSAELNFPLGVAVNSAGNIFIADRNNNRIRMVAGGSISTFAGTGASGFSGDSGPAASAVFNLPSDVVLDSSGNVYILDSSNFRIRVVNTQATTSVIQNISVPAGDIATIAGDGAGGYLTDNVAAASTSLTPLSVFVSGANNVYITDSNDERIREVSGGIITTVAGNGIAGNDSDIPATSARIFNPTSLYVSGAGDLFFSSGSGVQEVSGGFLQTALGNPAYGYGGDSGPAAVAQLIYPQGLAIDGSGNIVFADAGNYRIRKVNGITGLIQTIAGNGITASTGDNGLAVNASVEPATGLAIDHSGNIFFGEKPFAGPLTNCRIREIVAATGNIKTVAGTGTCGDTGDGAAATAANITQPNGVAVDAAGNLYILEGNGKPAIRVVNMQPATNLVINGITIAPGNIATIAGTGVSGYLGDGGLATAAEFSNPDGIFLDGSGNIYVADTGNFRIRVINTQATPIIVAGVSIAPGFVQTVVGSGNSGFSGDGGQALLASLTVSGLTIDGSGDIFFADGQSHVREVTNSTGIIQTIAGNGNRGFTGDGGPATSADLNSPLDVALDSAGRLYFSDEGNARIRVVGTLNSVPAITSLSPTQATAGSVTFTLTVNGADFISGATVDFNGVNETTTFVSSSQLTATIPAGDIANGGNFQVIVLNPEPSPGPSASVPFSVNNPAPTIASLNPSAVAVGGSGFLLTVKGTGFVPSSVVNFNGSPRSTVFTNTTTLSAQILSSDIAAVGSANIAVTNPAPGGGSSANFTFSISNSNPIPTLASISPSTASVGQSVNLTLAGTNFVAGSIVNFGANQDTGGVVSNGGNTLTITIPGSQLSSATTVNVSVTNPAPGGGTTSTQTFSINNPLPTITSLNPSSATAGGAGFSLTVNGTNFVSSSSVTVNGNSRTTTFVGNTQLTVSILASDIAAAGTFNVAVTNAPPGGGVSANAAFTVNNPAPTITSLSPNATSAGSTSFSLTVNGTNFVPTSVVNFNGNARSTGFVNSTQVTATILASDIATAGNQNVTVSSPAPGGGSSSPSLFVVLPASAAVFNPNPLAFNSGQQVNSSSTPLTVTLTNTGGEILNISNIGAVTGTNSNDFAFATAAAPVCVAGTPLAAGASCNIAFTFTPSASGARTAQVVFTDDAGGLVGSTQTLTLNGVGIAPAVQLNPASGSTLSFNPQIVNTTSASQVVTLTNTGSATLSLASASINPASPNASDFAIVAGAGTTCTAGAQIGFTAPNNTCIVTLTFTPTAVGLRGPAVLTFTDNAGEITGTTQTVNLTGTGQAPPTAVVPPSEAFGNQRLFTTGAATTVTVTNNGDATLNISSIALALTGNPGDFVLNAGSVSPCPLAGGAVTGHSSCTFNVAFDPTALGARSATVTLTDNANATGTPGTTQTVTLTGTGVFPQASPAPATVPFGNQANGATSTPQTITLSNGGTATLNLTSVVLGGTNPGAYAIASGTTCLNGGTVLAGASCLVKVTFTPNGLGSLSATITFTDDATPTTQVVTLTGTGVTSTVNFSSGVVAFGNQRTNTTAAQMTSILTNSGATALTISGVTLAGANPTDFAFATPATGTDCRTIGTVAPAGTCTIAATFTPLALGALNATVSVADNASGSPHTFQLTGTGTFPQATPTPSPAAFGNQRTNTPSATQVLTLTNGGTDTLHLTTVALGGTNANQFAIVPTGTTCTNASTIAPAASCIVNLTFTPTALGAQTATVTFTDDASPTTQVVNLTGTGVFPQASATPSPLAFGNQRQNTPSAAQTITLNNAGTGTLDLTTVVLGGTNASQFAIAAGTTCTNGSTVLAGGSCIVKVTFTPTALGAQAATITFTDDASPTTQVVNLTGTGVFPQASPTPVTVPFGNQANGATSTPQTITLSNGGTATLNLTSVVLGGTNPGAYAIVPGTTTCANGGTVAPSSSCVVNVTFTPTGLGSLSATITFTDDATPTTQVVTLTGTGVTSTVNFSSGVVAFGNQRTNTTAAQMTSILTNSGATALTISGVTLAGANPADFAFATPATGTDCRTIGTVAPAGTCTIAATFTPLALGALNATVSVADNASGSPHTFQLTGTGTFPQATPTPSPVAFGNQRTNTPSATQVLTLTNGGTDTLHLTTVALGGTNANQFAIVPTGTTCTNASTIAPAASCIVNLTFTPTALGAQTATVTFTDDASPTTQVVNLTGTGVFPQAAATPGTVPFGSQRLNVAAVAQTITLSNAGTGTLNLTSVLLGGTNPGDYAIAAGTTCTNGGTVAPSSSCIVNVTFTPTTLGSRTATVTFTDDASPTTQAVNLTGTGVFPQASPAPATVPFGNQANGSTSAPQTITLSNAGTGILNLTSVVLGGTNASAFAIASGTTCVNGGTVAAASSCIVKLTFTPTGLTPFAATLTFTDDANPTTQVVNVTGTGVASTVNFNPSTVAFGNQRTNTTSAQMTSILTNSGATTLTITGVTLTGANPADFALATPSSGTDCRIVGTVAPAGTCTIAATFAPLALGALNATVSVADSASGSPHTFQLTGTGTFPQAAPTPTPLAFANQIQTTTSAAQTLTLTNAGTDTLHLTTVALGGTNAADFSIVAGTTTCTNGSTVAPAASCVVNVTFTPASATAFTATITFTDDASPTTQVVTVTGTGVTPPTAGLSATTVPFGNQRVGTTGTATTITVTNGGGSQLAIAGIALAGAGNPGDFVLSAGATNPCPLAGGNVAGNSTCTFNVAFAPTAINARTATVTLTDNANATGTPGTTQTVTLNGTGIAPSAAPNPTTETFAAQEVSTSSAAQGGVLTNSGTDVLHITAVAIGGANATDFSIVAAGTSCETGLPTPVSVAAGNATCTWSVKFTPTATGTRTATLTFTDDNNAVPGSTQTVALTGTGTAPVVVLAPTSVTFPATALSATSAAISGTLTNTGTTALHITGVAITGPNAADFAIATGTTCTNTTVVAATSGACNWSVTFTPSVDGTRTASLTFTNDNGGTVGSTQTVPLTGTTVARATLTPTTLPAFGNQGVGTSSAPQTVTVTNPGGAPLHITTVTVVGTNAGDFAVATGTTCTNSTVAPAATCVINVTFTPTASGARGGTLTVTDDAGGTAGTTQTLALTGTGIDFTLAIPTAPAAVTAGQPISATIQITPGANGFPNPVTFVASNLPPDSTGTFSTSTLNSVTAQTTVTFTLMTTARTGSAPPRPSRPASRPPSMLWLTAAVLALLGIVTLKRAVRSPQRLAYLPLAVLLLSAAVVTGCTGGGAATPTGTPAGTYTVTITATSGAVVRTTTIPVTVQ